VLKFKGKFGGGASKSRDTVRWRSPHPEDRFRKSVIPRVGRKVMGGLIKETDSYVV